MNDPYALPPASAALLQKKIGWICNLVRWAGVVWFLWMLGIFVFVASHRADFLDKGLKFHEIDPASISNANYWLANAMNLIVYVPTAVTVWRLWELMQGYLEGDILTIRVAGRLRAVALAGLVAAATDVIAPLVSTLLITPQLLTKLPFWQMLRPIDLFYALVCGFLLALSAIFRTAVDIADEHAQIV